MSKQDGWIGVALVIAIGGGLIALLIVGFTERQNWLGKNCKVIGEISGSTGVGVATSGGVAIVNTPGKTGYQCNDGKTYWE